jgi:hypothetical protein
LTSIKELAHNTSVQHKYHKSVLLILGFSFILSVIAYLSNFRFNQQISLRQNIEEISANQWAFEETFSGTPSSPSQALLPKSFDYVVTHRDTGGGQQSGQNAQNKEFPADHNMNCQVANPGAISGQNPHQQHTASTNHISDANNPDKSFFICNDHMMSSMGHVDSYSVSSFFPRQEFDFSAGNGILEWDVSLPTGARSWWEVMLVPRSQNQLGAARDWLPISETYPKDRIVFIYEGTTRKIQVGKNTPPPQGMILDVGEWGGWQNRVPNDPALTDRRIRRKMQVKLNSNKIDWSIQKPDGSFDTYSVDVPGGLPFTRGLVVFKTHAYTPEKDGNMNMYTYHWDNIRFNGPKLTPYTAYEIPGVVELNGNGSVPIGSNKTVSLNLPEVSSNPILMGQTFQGMPGQVLLSINGGQNISVSPHSTSSTENSCYFGGWRTFQIPVDRNSLRVGTNTFKWTVGPRPSCASGQWWWDGFAVKAFEVQFDSSSSSVIATRNPSPSSAIASPSPVASPSLSPVQSPSLIPSTSPRATQPSPSAAANNILTIRGGSQYALDTPGEIVVARLQNGQRVESKRIVLDADVLANQLKTYTVSFSQPITSNNLRIYFTNDFCIWDPTTNNCENGEDRNIRITEVKIGTQTLSPLNPNAYSVGSWRQSDGCAAGFKRSEWLMCQGFFEWR